MATHIATDAPTHIDAQSGNANLSPDFASTRLAHLLAIGRSVGALRSHVRQTTTETSHNHQQNGTTITTTICEFSVTFTFRDESTSVLTPETPAPAASELSAPAANPSSPSPSVISIGSAVSEPTEYPPSFDDHVFQTPDTAGLQLSLSNSPVDVLTTGAPTRTPSPEPRMPESAVAGPSSAPIPLSTGLPAAAPATPHLERWYVVTVGSRVGVFQGWNDAASSVVGVSGGTVVRANSQAAGQAIFDKALRDGNVTVVA